MLLISKNASKRQQMNSDHIELVKGKQIRVSKETYLRYHI